MNSIKLYVYHLLVQLFPATRLFRVKRILLRWAGAVVEENVRIVSSARFQLTGQLVIGRNTWIGHEVLIVGGSSAVTIGRDVDIGPRVLLVTGSHHLSEGSDKAAGAGYSLPIVVGDGAWLGAAATVLGGNTVGPRSMVAAGSLVRSDVAEGSVVGGVPAALLRAGREKC